ncbi:RNA polymerase factor sigma-54 [Bryobacter aggregatus]|uniref:RNA polymerase factor sigma-54 n=1 Tax=Bryobacter aggregatus TaxID=360054 RepID=UPI0004E0EFDF|nr:RNA polymerase factor sigma-54 [Bryobacter aggregatus]
MLSPRLDVRVSQKQTLTPGLVQLVTVLQLNRLELRDMITQELVANPFLDETEGEELTPQEIQTLLEAERISDPSDQAVMEMLETPPAASYEAEGEYESRAAEAAQDNPNAVEEAPKAADPFDEIDFGSYFDEYLDPGHKTPAGEVSEKASFETFLSSPVTLASHLTSQLSLILMNDSEREAAEAIIGNLDENGYLLEPLEEIGRSEGLTFDDMEDGLEIVQSLDPAGIGARDMRECLMLQLKSNGAKGGVAWQIVSDHMRLLERREFKEIAKLLGRPQEHIDIALQVIRKLDPHPGLRYSSQAPQTVEPDVYIFKEGEDYLIQLNDEDMPQIRLNPGYRRMLDKDQAPEKDVRNYIRERYSSALMLMKNIEQRRQTILKVCQCVVERQRDFLEDGLDFIQPMMIKDLAEEIGVHPSTVSRAVAGKYVHTPQGVFELRFFFSEAVQGPAGAGTALLVLKRKVKKMIEDEDSAHPLTDDQITARLNDEGIQVTRRTVAKYREDLKIPSTHHRRVKK